MADKSKNSVIQSVTHHCQNLLELTYGFISCLKNVAMPSIGIAVFTPWGTVAPKYYQEKCFFGLRLPCENLNNKILNIKMFVLKN